MHWAALAKLEMFLEHPGRAARAARQAVALLSVTHGHTGGGGGVLGEVLRLQHEAEQEAAHLGHGQDD